VENEVPEAITFLGDAYRDGMMGLVKSDKKAAKLFKRAVELGDAEAMVNLGAAYYLGRGVKLDWKKAKRLHRMAADRGCATGQCNVGEICEVKEGDISEARKWYALSAAQGLKYAISALARLDAVPPTATAST
jgi:TPR repeat protein